MHNLKELFNETVSRGYPELIDIRIQIKPMRGDDAFMEIKRKSRHYHIMVDETMLYAPRKAVIGGLSHELSHILEDIGDTHKKKHDRMYAQCHKFKKFVQINADLQAILRGFAEELIAFKQYSRTQGYTIDNEGLRIEEIQQLLNQK